MKKKWTVYIIRAENGKLYTGITVDMERRFNEHQTGKKGAKFFRSTTPVEIVYQEKKADRSLASKREAAIKKLSRKKKEELIASKAK